MTPLRVLAIDDEPLALQRLAWCVDALPWADLVGTARDAVRGAEMINDLAPDVVLLDIEMPETSGLDLVERWAGPAAPQFVFVTAFDHFAAQAFDAHAADFVLKPVEFDRLQRALERARERLHLIDCGHRVAELKEIVASLRTARRTEPDQRYETALWVRDRDRRLRVPVDVIDYIAAEGDYARLYAAKASHLLRASMADLAKRLDPRQFMRVHRSTIVRQDLIAGMRGRARRQRLILKTGAELQIGKSYLGDVMRALRLHGSATEA